MYYLYTTKGYIIALIFIFLTQKTYSQLDKYIEIALQNNLSYLESLNELKVNQINTKISKNLLLPKVTFDNNYFLSEGGRKIKFPAGDLLNPIYRTLYKRTNNQLFNLTVPNIEEQFYPDNFYRTNLNIIVPIINKKIWNGKKKAVVIEQIGDYKKSIVHNNVVKNVSLTFYEFHKIYKMLDFQDYLINYLKRLKLKTEKLLNHDLVEPLDLDLINYELIKQNHKKEELNNSLKLLKNKFTELLGTAEAIDENDFKIKEIPINDFKIKPLKNLDSLLKEKKSIKIIDLKSKIIDLNHKETNRLIPDFGINFKTGLEGFKDEANIKNDFFYLGVFNLSWSLYDGSKSLQSKKTKANKTLLDTKSKVEKSLIKLKIVETKTHLENLYAELKIFEKKKNLSEKILNQQRSKYLKGDIDIVELINYKIKYEEDVTKYFTAKISYIQKTIDYNFFITP